ncbi:MAG: sugar phosphate nucleotidyltransferase, partial [Bacteroidota bacterium]
ENTPKPLLPVGDKPIIEHNIDRLKDYGISNITLSINYLGEQLVSYFGDGSQKDLNIRYVEETRPLGTMGSVTLLDEVYNDYILVMNSDLLTTIDFESLFKDLIEKEGDMIIATTPYKVKVPYGVIETSGDEILQLTEKPTYTYYSNAGIYIFKKEYLERIPKNQHFNANELMELLIAEKKRVLHFPILGYWLDIGKPNDYEKAQTDIKHLQL